jgi:HEAT repeat protein
MTWMRQLLAITLLVMLPLGACAQTPASEPLTVAQDMELKTLTGQLADLARADKTKQEAAELLLVRPYPQAVEALKKFLLDSTNRPAQTAVAEAIARHGSSQRIFIDPLVAMLTGSDASVREVAGRALAACRSCGGTTRLMDIAGDTKIDRAIRLLAIQSLQRVLDKDVVGSLIRLLDDSDPAIRSEACDALGKLTNIRAFGSSRTQWKQWWQQNMNKDRTVWLADLADSLVQSKAVLEVENARLRTRLAKSMIDLFTITPAAQRDAMLMNFLKDPLADVRLVALELLGRNIDGGGTPSAELCQQVRLLVTDSDDHVRQEAARLLAVSGDAQALAILLDRLKVEAVPSVRQGIVMALGQLRNVKALPAVLLEIDSKDEEVAAAAAIAVGRIASKSQLDDADRKQAVAAISNRYSTAATSPAALREALLAAMGDLGDKSFIPLLDGALQDDSAPVRLAAVNSLAQLNSTASAPAIEKLIADSDRGVRGSVISALRLLGGAQYLQLILQRTDPGVEDDAANRQQAWDLVMGILAKADAKVLTDTAEKLANRSDAVAQRIKILQMLVAIMKDTNEPQLPAVLRQVGLVLVTNDRCAEASTYLADAYKLLLAAKSPQAPVVWLEWVDAMLAADDPAAIKEIAAQADGVQFAAAMERFDSRLMDLDKKAKWQSIITMTTEAFKQLQDRLSESQRNICQNALVKARGQQTSADRQKVAKLVLQMTSGDESARKSASADILAMGDRAVDGLLVELKTNLEADNTNQALEQNIIEMLRQVAPKLTLYDAAAPKDQKLKMVTSWMTR